MSTAAETPNSMPGNEQGFTLVEILVAVLILSLGVVGLIGMESLALKSNLSAYHRSQATLLAYELADKMRSNPAGVAGNEYIAAFPNGASHAVACVSYSGAVSGSGCSPQQLAERDIYEWTSSITGILPGGVGALTASAGIQTIAIRWDDNRDGVVDPVNESFVFSFGL